MKIKCSRDPTNATETQKNWALGTFKNNFCRNLQGGKVSQLQELLSRQNAWIISLGIISACHATPGLSCPICTCPDSLIRPSAGLLKGQEKQGEDEKKGMMTSLKAVSSSTISLVSRHRDQAWKSSRSAEMRFLCRYSCKRRHQEHQ